LIATIRFCSVTQLKHSNVNKKSNPFKCSVTAGVVPAHEEKNTDKKWFQIVSTSHTYRCELPGTIFSWNNKNSINKSITESAWITVLLGAAKYNCKGKWPKW
jgi:hypothetical protein